MNLGAVLVLAEAEGLTQIYYNADSRVVSFSKIVDDELVRINVYWTTATVGTCLHHPRQGKTQLFRRNVDFGTLKWIFRFPRLHTGDGYYRGSAFTFFRPGDRAHVSGYADCAVRSKVVTTGQYRGRIQVEYDDGSFYHVRPGKLLFVAVDEEAEALRQLQRLEAEESTIQDEKAQIQAILAVFSEERRRKAEEEEGKRQQRLAEYHQKIRNEMQELRRDCQRALEQAAAAAALQTERDQRGRFMQLRHFEGDFVHECFGETVTCVACGGNGIIMLYESGVFAYTSILTTNLNNKLRGRQKSLPPAEYVAMGSMDRYFVRFADGKSEWVGCAEMSTAINNAYGSQRIKTVAFGENWTSYFVVFDDGGFSCQGVPNALDKLIKSRRLKGDLECVSLGPNGEYFLTAKNGRMWWGNICSRNLNEIRAVRDRALFLDFGDNHSYICRYT